MNYIKNDRGETVIAEGSPNSRARMAARYPKLIERYKVKAYYESCPILLKDDLIRQEGLEYWEADLILELLLK